MIADARIALAILILECPMSSMSGKLMIIPLPQISVQMEIFQVEEEITVWVQREINAKEVQARREGIAILTHPKDLST